MGLDVDIDIAALQIEGMDARRGEAIAAALRAELARLVAAGGLASTASARIDARTVTGSVNAFDHDANPGLIGARLAHAVYQGLVGAGAPKMAAAGDAPSARPYHDD